MKLPKHRARIEQLASSLLRGGLDAGEEAELKELLKESLNKEYFRHVYSISVAGSGMVDTEGMDRVYGRILGQIDRVPRIGVTGSQRIPSRRRRAIAAVAAILIVVGAGIYGLGTVTSGGGGSATTGTRLTVPYGSVSTITLPDGSTAMLNSGTTLSYSPQFGSADRSLRLDGEAFFDVAPNRKLPFIVTTGHTSVEALGTRFNVEAYAAEPTVTATLFSGSVRVLPDTGSPTPYILEPGQSLTVTDRDDGKITVILSTDAADDASWTDGRMVIRSEPLASVARKLERKYDVRVTIADTEILDYDFSGVIKDETLEQTLSIIKIIAPVNYELRGKELRISLDRNRMDMLFRRSLVP